jgi:hypothetical protein
MVVVSNLSARQPCDAVRSRMSPRPVSTDELGRYGAEQGSGERCVGAALASHGRGLYRLGPGGGACYDCWAGSSGAAALTARGHARHHASNNDFSGMPCDARLRGGRPAAVPRWHARDRGSNPLSSNQAEALSAVDRPELPASGSKSAASCSARPIQSCGAAGRCRCRRLVDPGPPGRRSCATKTGSAGLGKVDHRRAAWQFRALSERLDPRGAFPISGSSPGCSGTPELDCSAIPA